MFWNMYPKELQTSPKGYQFICRRDWNSDKVDVNLLTWNKNEPLVIMEEFLEYVHVYKDSV